ncbi:hypothetical protein PHYSODRAFT_286060 [Phytophthora sojae]|uniref:Secreted protein n=1 Tax=Phytophthora sojae (strain P6497) TaxID=1094619 RepID=G4ZCU8_PHYSP|nr:hypothetical protein PHYSODRAFT_286060 [Phytophthora sojae]EGZ18306.1 hypothetical protein PHYSODRAFT_286060 [Phytophthora sojae]|eukprot:XP_009527364.1 hypothetical protein PHYSODRAFT_286060 [Phytophthora sojae]
MRRAVLRFVVVGVTWHGASGCHDAISLLVQPLHGAQLRLDSRIQLFLAGDAAAVEAARLQQVTRVDHHASVVALGLSASVRHLRHCEPHALTRVLVAVALRHGHRLRNRSFRVGGRVRRAIPSRHFLRRRARGV